MFSLICVWINGWVNNREASDLRRYLAHYDVTVMIMGSHTVDTMDHEVTNLQIHRWSKLRYSSQKWFALEIMTIDYICIIFKIFKVMEFCVFPNDDSNWPISPRPHWKFTDLFIIWLKCENSMTFYKIPWLFPALRTIMSPWLFPDPYEPWVLICSTALLVGLPVYSEDLGKYHAWCCPTSSTIFKICLVV